MGSFVFSVNLLPLWKIITDHSVFYELYADDNQLYIVCNHPEGDITNIALESVIFDTHHWLTMNFQKIIDGKIEMMLISCSTFHQWNVHTSLFWMKSLHLQIHLGTWECTLIPQCVLTTKLPILPITFMGPCVPFWSVFARISLPVSCELICNETLLQKYPCPI